MTATYLHSDEEVLIPVLRTELVDRAKILIKQGLSPQQINKVFLSVCQSVTKMIQSSTESMKGLEMKHILSRYYATQLPTRLFGSESLRAHMAQILVGAVYASGYDYKEIGPFHPTISDFEDGFNLIEIKKVSGGCGEDSFFVEGVAFRARVGLRKQSVVMNPKILLLNTKPDPKSPEKDKRADVNIIDLVDKHAKGSPVVVLSHQAIDECAKKGLAARTIYLEDLVSADDLSRVVEVICAMPIPYNDDIDIGSCKHYQQKKSGKELFGVFTGCRGGKAVTIVLRGDDKFIKEARMYILDMMADVRSIMKDGKIVEGGRPLYDRIIRHVRGVAKQMRDKNVKRIIEAFASAIKVVSDKTYNIDGCNAVKNPRQKHAAAHGERVLEPPIIKISAIDLAVLVACRILDSCKTETEEAIKNQNDKGKEQMLVEE